MMKFDTIKELNQKHMLKVLDYTKWNKTKSADILGISLRTLRNWLNALDKEGVEKIEPLIPTRNVDNGFPTNEYRIRYRDNMLNKDRL